MNRKRLVEKTLENRRGYKYHTYETELTERDGSEVFSLYHYGTRILSVDLSEKSLIRSRTTSVSDRDMVNIALCQIDTKNRMCASKNYGIKEVVSSDRFLRHMSGRTRIFDKGRRIDRDGSALITENLHTGAFEVFETSTRRRKFWLRRDPENGEKPELFGREAKEPVDNAEYIGDIGENDELAALVVGYILKGAPFVDLSS